jgi:D-serine deaminase-like pyridoxal phosphate-dependent protein
MRLGDLERATASLDPPFALVDLDAFWSNGRDLVRRAGGKPIRLASKSVRCRSLQERVLEMDGFDGTLSFTLPEALWLQEHGFENIVVGYPTAHRDALSALGERPIALMVDGSAQLDLIDSVIGTRPYDIRLCIDVDAGWWLMGDRLKIGAKRSPIHGVDQAVSLAREIEARPGFKLVGIMSYEAQIAGVGDRPPGKPLRGMLLRAMQSRSATELEERRAEVVAAVRKVAELEFVNGGGTGSVERTVSEPAITEVAAGSGLFAPTLFDAYGSFTPVPAAMFALPVVRKPSPSTATVLGGGYLASGVGDETRLPRPFLPEGLKLDSQEGAGEVQTPLSGAAAATLKVGDRVYFRHAKAGEMCERFDRLYLLQDGEVVEQVPTYRGEGQTFL